MKNMTEAELMQKMKALDLPEGDACIPDIVCSLIGHSRIIVDDFFYFGYKYCARCNAQVGDSLAGYWDGTNTVVVGHNCETCQANYQKMTWRDKFLCPDPFAEPAEEMETAEIVKEPEGEV